MLEIIYQWVQVIAPVGAGQPQMVRQSSSEEESPILAGPPEPWRAPPGRAEEHPTRPESRDPEARKNKEDSRKIMLTFLLIALGTHAG
jgi:hypothetical protein